MLNFDADVKEMTVHHQCENRLKKSNDFPCGHCVVYVRLFVLLRSERNNQGPDTPAPSPNRTGPEAAGLRPVMHSLSGPSGPVHGAVRAFPASARPSPGYKTLSHGGAAGGEPGEREIRGRGESRVGEVSQVGRPGGGGDRARWVGLRRAGRDLGGGERVGWVG